MLALDDVKDEFIWEGSLRDICILETTMSDWRAVWRLLSRLDTIYKVEGVEAATPDDVVQIIARPGERTHLLAVLLAGVQLNCHFFDQSEIEFDLDPREVSDQPRFEVIVSFMADLANATGKAALMTPDNMHEHPFLRVQPSSKVEYIPTGGYFREAAEQHAEFKRQALARSDRLP
jgi:hypothetical protein